jgi:hypothetical protein
VYCFELLWGAADEDDRGCNDLTCAAHSSFSIATIRAPETNNRMNSMKTRSADRGRVQDSIITSGQKQSAKRFFVDEKI